MRKNIIEAYKAAVRAKYKEEKFGEIPNPSAAKLRDLCIRIFTETKNPEDLSAFRIFFGFEFKEDEVQKIKKDTDRFKPIGTFLKGETELRDEAIDMAAILVDFKPRPLQKFTKEFQKAANPTPAETETDPGESETMANEKENPDTIQGFVNIDDEKKDGIPPVPPKGSLTINERSAKFLWAIGGATVLILLIWVMTEHFFTPKNCMIWTSDHYEAIDCNTTAKSGKIIALDEKLLLEFKQLPISSSLVFFDESGQPIVWYSKSPERNIELFNSPGKHPVTGETLKKITPNIISTYIDLNPNK